VDELEINELNGGIEVTIFLSKTNIDGLVDRLVDRLVDGLVESQFRIIELIKKNPKISKKTMAEQIGISQTAIDKHIKTAKEKKLIRRIGSDRNGIWQIIDNQNLINNRDDI